MQKKYKIIIVTIVIALVATLLWKTFQPVERANAISSVSSLGTADIDPLKVANFYNQRDPKWASDMLGNTTQTVGKVGCLLSSVCMNFSYYDENITPKEMNVKLRELEGYTSRGWLIWNRLNTISRGKLSVVFPKLSHENIEKYLNEKKPVLAKVYINKVIPHWVLIVGKKGKEYLMLDPLTQGELRKLSYYGGYVYSIRVLKN